MVWIVKEMLTKIIIIANVITGDPFGLPIKTETKPPDS